MKFKRLVKAPFKVKQQQPGSQEVEVQPGEVIYTFEPDPHRYMNDEQDASVEFTRDNELICKGQQPIYLTTYFALAASSHPDPCGHPSKENLDAYKVHCKDCGEVWDMPISEGGPFKNGLNSASDHF